VIVSVATTAAAEAAAIQPINFADTKRFLTLFETLLMPLPRPDHPASRAVRRLLRHRSDKDIGAGAKLDVGEADETVALVNFVIICRNYASELAISEVTLRSFSELQHYLESATEALVESLRHASGKVRTFRHAQVELAIRFCEVIFGHDYAALMTKASEVALAGEKKSSRAG